MVGQSVAARDVVHVTTSQINAAVQGAQTTAATLWEMLPPLACAT
jgi:hypothetical protein